MNSIFNQTFKFRREFLHAYNDDEPSTNANGVRRRRVLVVGAGVAGVATAFALAKRGFSVAVVEAADRPGEECRSGRGGNYPVWRFFFYCCRCLLPMLPLYVCTAFVIYFYCGGFLHCCFISNGVVLTIILVDVAAVAHFIAACKVVAAATIFLLLLPVLLPPPLSRL